MLARLKWIGWLGLALSVTITTVALAPSRALAAETKATDEEAEEDAAKPDPDQPKYTAGALWTRATYSKNEVERPLNMTERMVEGRLDLLTDIAKGSAFKNFILRLTARYGVMDTLEVQAGTSLHLAAPEGGEKPKSVFVAVQQSILHDLLAARLALNLPVDPKFLFDIAIGFPIKFRLVPEKIAIEALEEILVIHTGAPTEGADTPAPNINISVGGVFQILDNLALRLRARVLLNLDDTSLSQIPIELDIQFSPINILDFGLFVALNNLNAKDPVKPFDQRSLGLFVRARY